MKPLPLLLCLPCLTACSHKVPEPQVAAQTEPPRVATPWDGMKKDEQRARDVQKAVDAQAAQQRKRIEAQAQ